MILPYKGIELQRRAWMVSCAAVSLLGVALMSIPNLGAGLASLSYDLPYLFRGEISSSNVVVVLEDSATLAGLGVKKWPPPRKLQADVVDKLRAEGAKEVVFDIWFRSPASDDDALAAAMKRQGNVVLAADVPTSIVDTGGVRAESVTMIPPAPALLKAAATSGHMRIVSRDPSIGSRNMVKSSPGVETLFWAAAARSGSLPPGEAPERERWMNFYGSWQKVNLMPRVTLEQLFGLNEQRSPPGFFTNKIVFIGTDLREDLCETYRFKKGVVCPGVEVQANACANLLDGDWLRRAGVVWQTLIAGLFGLGATMALIWVGRKWVFPLAGVVFVLLAAGSLFLQWRAGVWWNWLTPAGVQLPLAALLAYVSPRMPVAAFISYRRKGGDAFALMLLQSFWLRGRDALLDVNEIMGGEFGPQILAMIDRAPNFILVLSPGALDERIQQENDWMRQEVERAFQRNKRVIPILLPGFEFEQTAPLPATLQRLTKCQSILHHHDKWEATLKTLEEYILARRGVAETGTGQSPMNANKR